MQIGEESSNSQKGSSILGKFFLTTFYFDSKQLKFNAE
jgi:hypothetical protein